MKLVVGTLFCLALARRPTATDAFVMPSALSSAATTTAATSSLKSKSTSRLFSSSMMPPSSTASTAPTPEEIRRDIEQMRQEALQRLTVLNEKVQQAASEAAATVASEIGASAVTPAAAAAAASVKESPLSPTSLAANVQSSRTTVAAAANALKTVTSATSAVVDDMADLKRMEAYAQESGLKQRMVRDVPTRSGQIQPESRQSVRQDTQLLQNSRWKVMLNVGRENGTWMPKTWGVSGERLLMNLQLEFTSDLLYEQEDFLGGIQGSQVVKVMNDMLTLGPSMSEGAKKVRAKSGGWRIARGEGPMGTDVLKFFVDLEEEGRHQGSDVYCPAGRVYCTCGFFNMQERKERVQGGMKERIQYEQEQLNREYQRLVQEGEQDSSIISFSKVKRAREMMNLRVHAEKLAQQFNELRVQQPDKSLLRLDRNQKIGLTKEGGLCCKVQKGLAIEYHILGKFEVASIENREHSLYQDLLP